MIKQWSAEGTLRNAVHNLLIFRTFNLKLYMGPTFFVFNFSPTSRIIYALLYERGSNSYFMYLYDCMDSFCHFSDIEAEIARTILDGVQGLWSTRMLSDITLVADGHEFPCHRVVLAAASDYFMAMFNGNWSPEANTNVVEMKAVTAEGLEPLLKYIYTGKLDFTNANVHEVFLAASHIQLIPAVRKTSEYILKQLDIDNCVDVYNMAITHGLQKVGHETYVFINSNFTKIIKSRHHCHMELSDLLYFVDGESSGEDVLELREEMKVFSCLVDWLRYDPYTRMRYVVQVAETVRFPLMSVAQINNIILNPPFAELETHPECRRLIANALNYHSQPPWVRTVTCSKETRIRSRESVVCIGRTDSHEKKVFLLSPHGDLHSDPVANCRWEELSELTSILPPDILAATEKPFPIVVNNFLVVLIYSSDSGLYKCHLFDPVHFIWSRLSDLHRQGCDIVPVACADHLYVFGGGSDACPSKNIAKFCFRDNVWTEFGAVKPCLHPEQACSVDGKVFIYGRTDSAENSSRELWSFDPETSNWEKNYLGLLPNMCEVKMLASKEELYIVDSHTGKIEYLNLLDNQWFSVWMRRHMWGQVPTHSLLTVAGDNLFYINGRTNPKSGELAEDSGLCAEVTVGYLFSCTRPHVVTHNPLPTELSSAWLICSLRI